MHVDIECRRLHAWSWVVEDDFGQSSIQAGPSASCVPYFKACAEWKFATTRTWGSPGTGVSYLHARQFACCLLRFAHSGSVEDEEFSLNWDNGSDWGWVQKHLPCCTICPSSLCTLEFADDFNYVGWCFYDNLDNVTWPASLQSLTFGARFDQTVDNMTWPEGLQSLTFGGIFPIRAWTMWLDGRQAWVKAMTFGRDISSESGQVVTWPAVSLQSLILVGIGIVSSIRAWTTWHGHQAFKVWLLVPSFRMRTYRQHDMASRPSKFDIEESRNFNHSLDKSDMASRPSKTWPFGSHSIFDSEAWQCDMASKPSKLLVTFRSGPAWHVWRLVITSSEMDNLTWPPGLQSLTVWIEWLQSEHWTTWHGHQALQSLTFGR